MSNESMIPDDWVTIVHGLYVCAMVELAKENITVSEELENRLFRMIGTAFTVGHNFCKLGLNADEFLAHIKTQSAKEVFKS